MNKWLGDVVIRLVEDKVEEVAVSTLEGEGKVVAVYFSAHWCPPCRYSYGNKHLQIQLIIMSSSQLIGPSLPSLPSGTGNSKMDRMETSLRLYSPALIVTISPSWTISKTCPGLPFPLQRERRRYDYQNLLRTCTCTYTCSTASHSCSNVLNYTMDKGREGLETEVVQVTISHQFCTEASKLSAFLPIFLAGNSLEIRELCFLETSSLPAIYDMPIL